MPVVVAFAGGPFLLPGAPLTPVPEFCAVGCADRIAGPHLARHVRGARFLLADNTGCAGVARFYSPCRLLPGPPEEMSAARMPAVP